MLEEKKVSELNDDELENVTGGKMVINGVRYVCSAQRTHYNKISMPSDGKCPTCGAAITSEATGCAVKE